MAVLFLTLLITCRITGLPFAEEYGTNTPALAGEQLAR